ncbi:MAG: methyltransferase domain-containing protein [Bacteroidota bacterium]
MNNTDLACMLCKRTYSKNKDGFYNFLTSVVQDPGHHQDELYLEQQETYPLRVYSEFLLPIIKESGSKKILDAGCGLGTEINEALKDGYYAYGIDLPNMLPYWSKKSNDPDSFIACSAVSMPFPDNSFDLIWSLGVVEHIGTSADTATLIPEYQAFRAKYANELLRVIKPGGKIIISCPNKSFPIDIHHGPTCGNHLVRFRWYIFNKTGLNFHKIWGKYHLLSYAETRRLFLHNKMTGKFKPLPLKGYFGFDKFKTGSFRFVGNLIRYYVEHLPKLLLGTFLNPYMLVIIEKKKT